MVRKDIRQLPPQEELLRLFSYDVESGEIRWRVSHGYKIAAGSLAGHEHEKSGYWLIGLNNKAWLAHRIIWKMMTGNDPDNQIDHIDMDRSNNRWANLRQASNGQNKVNGRLYKNNKSGHKGVCWDEHHGSWSVQIKSRRVARRKSLDAAIALRRRLASSAYGVFANSEQ